MPQTHVLHPTNSSRNRRPRMTKRSAPPGASSRTTRSCSGLRIGYIAKALALLILAMSGCVADQPFGPEDIDEEVAKSNEVIAEVEDIYCGCYLDSRHNGNMEACRSAAFGQRIELSSCQRDAAECYSRAYIENLRCQRERIDRFGDCVAGCPSSPSACEQQFVQDTCPSSPERAELDQMMERCASGSSTLCNR